MFVSSYLELPSCKKKAIQTSCSNLASEDLICFRPHFEKHVGDNFLYRISKSNDKSIYFNSIHWKFGAVEYTWNIVYV